MKIDLNPHGYLDEVHVLESATVRIFTEGNAHPDAWVEVTVDEWGDFEIRSGRILHIVPKDEKAIRLKMD